MRAVGLSAAMFFAIRPVCTDDCWNTQLSAIQYFTIENGQKTFPLPSLTRTRRFMRVRHVFKTRRRIDIP